jgi:hypothetical protein
MRRLKKFDWKKKKRRRPKDCDRLMRKNKKRKK